jgi:hypothetical protein
MTALVNLLHGARQERPNFNAKLAGLGRGQRGGCILLCLPVCLSVCLRLSLSLCLSLGLCLSRAYDASLSLSVSLSAVLLLHSRNYTKSRQSGNMDYY